MKGITLKEIYRKPEEFTGEEVILKGWVRNNRDQKSFGFLTLNDGTYFKPVQIVYEKKHLDDYEAVAALRTGAAVTVQGRLVLTPEARQPFEVKASKIVLSGDSLPDYPIQPKRHSREFLREVAHLRPRTNLFTAVFRVRSLLSFALHSFFQQKGFVYVHAPLITASDAEGAGQMFGVTTLNPLSPPLDEAGQVDYSKDFFGKKTSLTGSGQLEAEAFALAFRNVYTFGPTFRAENSNTARHAAEFWMIEPEMAFCDLAGNMDLAEEMVKYLIDYLFEEAIRELTD